MADWLEARRTAPEGAPKGERKLADLGRYATSIAHWLRFFTADRSAGHVSAAHSVEDVGSGELFHRFVAMREADGVGAHTISRDLAALRAVVNWAWRKRRVPSAPFIADVGYKPPEKELVYTAEQVARLLEVARARPDRAHVHLFVMILLSTCLRVEAILELDASQLVDGAIHSLRPGRRQTSKRRSVVPIAPTLAPWLEGRRGKLIQYCVARSAKPTKIAANGEAPVRRKTASIKTAFANCLRAAGLVRLGSDGAALLDASGRPLPLGSPNTLRHTVQTELHRRGIPEAQIEAAAGHRGKGTGKRNYVHLRPGHMAEFVAGVEAYWAEVGRYTSAALRYQRDTNVVELAGARASVGRENG